MVGARALRGLHLRGALTSPRGWQVLDLDPQGFFLRLRVPPATSIVGSSRRLIQLWM